uniref:Secreted protein n=1 Tax=Romanomermis culicivorax TaxID=13658 RepID=A0A915IW55_ROMCU
MLLNNRTLAPVLVPVILVPMTLQPQQTQSTILCLIKNTEVILVDPLEEYKGAIDRRRSGGVRFADFPLTFLLHVDVFVDCHRFFFFFVRYLIGRMMTEIGGTAAAGRRSRRGRCAARGRAIVRRIVGRRRDGRDSRRG